MKIYWQDIYTVNVKELDDQHKHMVELINEGHEIVGNPTSGTKDYEELLEKLTSHALNHFATEEKYFKLYNFEQTEEHVAQHKEITETVVDFKKRFDENKSHNIIFEILEFLDDWLFVHIMQYDKKYTKCFNEHGLF